MAITLRGERPAKATFHADRGTHYASEQITALANENGLTRSMGFTGMCWDNATAESLFATLKTDLHYRRVRPTKRGAHLAVGNWIEDRDHRRRRHASLGQVSPVNFEIQYLTNTATLKKAA
jgi:transposase InsO family protein